jgi:2-C-methyl-D-erythritol 4-phosphate cytidylyltransferase
MKDHVIIVAGGSGKRMSQDQPKQLLELAGMPLLMHSLIQFNSFDPQLTIIVSLHPSYMDVWKQLCNKHGCIVPHQLVSGGETRYHSVKNGLYWVGDECLVAVHDAARPLISQQLIRRTFEKAREKGSAVPCIPVNDTIRQIDGGQVIPIERSTLRIIQTPQVFHSSLLKKAYEQPFDQRFTDDGSLLEAMGMQVNLVEGDPENFKITYPGDLEKAEAILKNR